MMSEPTLTPDARALIDAYISAVDRALASQYDQATDRSPILDDLRAQIWDMLRTEGVPAVDTAAVQAVLKRLDSPEHYAGGPASLPSGGGRFFNRSLFLLIFSGICFIFLEFFLGHALIIIAVLSALALANITSMKRALFTQENRPLSIWIAIYSVIFSLWFLLLGNETIAIAKINPSADLAWKISAMRYGTSYLVIGFIFLTIGTVSIVSKIVQFLRRARSGGRLNAGH
jgi:hypothetical protein